MLPLKTSAKYFYSNFFYLSLTRRISAIRRRADRYNLAISMSSPSRLSSWQTERWLPLILPSKYTKHWFESASQLVVVSSLCPCMYVIAVIMSLHVINAQLRDEKMQLISRKAFRDRAFKKHVPNFPWRFNVLIFIFLLFTKLSYVLITSLTSAIGLLSV